MGRKLDECVTPAEGEEKQTQGWPHQSDTISYHQVHLPLPFLDILALICAGAKWSPPKLQTISHNKLYPSIPLPKFTTPKTSLKIH